MTAPTTSSVLEAYVHGVSPYLADLQPSVRNELLADLREHLAALLAENRDLDLASHLGAPAAYADELRQTAGFGPAVRPRAAGLGERLDRMRDGAAGFVRSLPGGPWLLGALPQFRGTWWLIRVYGLLALVELAWHGGTYYRYGHTIIPTIHNSTVIGSAFFLLLLVASVVLGQRARHGVGAVRMALVVLNLLLLLATPAYLRNVHLDEFGPAGSADLSTPCCGSITGNDGKTITNIYGYDEHGKRISRVQLFDQDGQPVNVYSNPNPSNDPLHNVFPQPNDQPARAGDLPSPQPVPQIAAPVLAP